LVVLLFLCALVNVKFHIIQMALSTGKTKKKHRVETGGFFAKSCTLFSRLVYTGDALTSLLSNPSDLRV
jgi:hypothetical protein